VLIQTSLGQTYLINGAASGREIVSRLDAEISPFDRELDGLILTDSEAKPLGGLPFLAEQVKINNVLWGELVPANPATRRLEAALRQDGAISNLLEAGQEYILEPGLLLKVIVSGEEGTALGIVYGDFMLLLPGGVSPLSIKDILRRSPPSIIVLDENDLVDTDAEDWLSLSSLGVIWNNVTESTPDESWIQTAEQGEVEIITDGRRLYLVGRD